MATATERQRAVDAGAFVTTMAGIGVGLALLPALARADSMRCGSRVVKDGDTIEKVLDTCGEPVTRERTWIQRQPRYKIGEQEYSFPGQEDVPVDLWTYDFGPHKLTQRLRFIAGELESIVTLGRGTNQ